MPQNMIAKILFARHTYIHIHTRWYDKLCLYNNGKVPFDVITVGVFLLIIQNTKEKTQQYAQICA